MIVLLLAACSIEAQQMAPSPSPQGEVQTVDNNETVRVESDLVDLNVTVFNNDAQRTVGQLEQKDFAVFEDGVEQQISLFAAATAPFDLILLLDLSASTKDKFKLIRKSAASFVDAARPTDRIGIITFTDSYEVVSPLTFEREALRARIKDMKKPKGGTNFWDAMRYVVETMFNPTDSTRRTAVVMMTDGVDNALPDIPGVGSVTSFERLVGIIQRSDSILIPIYLDTEREMIQDRGLLNPGAYQIARRQLQLLASESGGKLYYAGKVEDLKDVYVQVIHDLSTVYSIGYSPSRKSRDGLWRTVKVELAGRPDLAARARRGYFATSK